MRVLCRQYLVWSSVVLLQACGPPQNEGKAELTRQSRASPCSDPLGCVSYAPNTTIYVASAQAVSGPAAFLGIDQVRGTEVALLLQGSLFGRPLGHLVYDSQCSPEGGAAAGSAIAADASTILGVVGTSCSGAANTALPFVSAAGLVMGSGSNTAPTLTDPAGAFLPGYYRSAWNDLLQGGTGAEFSIASPADNGLGAKTAAVFHCADPYCEGLANAFADRFQALGGEVKVIAAVSTEDAGRLLNTVVKPANPDVLFLATFEDVGAQVVDIASEVLPGTELIGGDGMLSETVIAKLARKRARMHFTVANFAFTSAYGPLIDEFVTLYGEPFTPFHAYAYDATNLLLAAAELVGIVDSGGTLHIGRQALRDALYAIKDFDGATGSLTCSPFGDCGGTSMLVLTHEDGATFPSYP